MTTQERDALGRFVAYVNDECPDECNRAHDEPEPNHHGQWSCPTTGERFVRDDGAWVVPNRWHTWSTYVEVADEWYIHPNDHGWEQCNGCGDYVGAERMRSDDWEDQYCGDCIDECGHFGRDDDYYDDDDDDCYNGRTPSFTTPACDVCGHRVPEVTHYEPITDQVACAECARLRTPFGMFVRIPTFELVAA